MADLKRTHRWERYAPDIGDNREQPDGQRLELEVASSLTHEQFAEWESALRVCLDEAKADTGSSPLYSGRPETRLCQRLKCPPDVAATRSTAGSVHKAPPTRSRLSVTRLINCTSQ